MKKKPSSVPSGMHSLAQRSQQERRQRAEEQQPHRTTMQQVPPPPVQRPEKILSPEALAALRQQTQHAMITPEMMQQMAELAQQADATPKAVSMQDGKISFVESSSVSEEPKSKPETPMPMQATAMPTPAAPSVAAEPTIEATTPSPTAPKRMPPIRDARMMPTAKPKGTSVPVAPAPKTGEPIVQTTQAAKTSSTDSVSPELLQKISQLVQKDDRGKVVLTPELLQQIVAMAQNTNSNVPTVKANTQSEPPVQPVTPPEPKTTVRKQRVTPQMPKGISEPEISAAPTSKTKYAAAKSEPEEELSPFVTTAMLRQRKAEMQSQPTKAKQESPQDDALNLLQGKRPVRVTESNRATMQHRQKSRTTPVSHLSQPIEKNQQTASFRPVKPQDVSINTMPEQNANSFVEATPQVAGKRPKHRKNQQPRESVAELTGTSERKTQANTTATLQKSSSTRAKKFFQELFWNDAPVDPEVQRTHTAAPTAAASLESAPEKPEELEESRSAAVYAEAEQAIPEERVAKRPVISHALEDTAESDRPVRPAGTTTIPKKRPVISHAKEPDPKPESIPELQATVQTDSESVGDTKKLASAAFYERLFQDFPETEKEEPSPTEEELAQQQRKKKMIASVKGAVSEAEQGNSNRKRISKQEFLKRKAQRLAMTIGVSVIGGITLVVAAVLLFGPRSTISYEENRVLAEKPKFSLTALLDGTYASGWAEYYNDTVPFRSTFKDTISAMMQWTGVQSEEDTVFFGNVQQVKKSETTTTAETTTATTAAGAAGQGTTETAVTTTTVVTTTEDPDDEPAAEIGDGIILDHKRAICVYGGSFSVGQDYAENLNAYKEALGDDVNVYSMVATTAVTYYLPEEYADYTASEIENIDNINSYLKDVTPIDVYAALSPHVSEAIYARTDHHWLPLGAYYAAQAFAEAADVPFADLSEYDTDTKTDYVGSMYTYTESAVLLDNPEEFTYYIPKNKYTTTYYSTSFTDPQEGDLLMNLDGYDNSMYYLVFMGGDDKITHVETDCKNNRTLVIFKDSYGNALVPCLTQSFENIYVCDMRYFDINAITFCQEVGCTDLLFAMNTYSATGGNESYLESNRLQ